MAGLRDIRYHFVDPDYLRAPSRGGLHYAYKDHHWLYDELYGLVFVEFPHAGRDKHIYMQANTERIVVEGARQREETRLGPNLLVKYYPLLILPCDGEGGVTVNHLPRDGYTGCSNVVNLDDALPYVEIETPYISMEDS